MLVIGVSDSDEHLVFHAALLQLRLPVLYGLWKHTKPEVYQCENTEMAVVRKVAQWVYSNDYDERNVVGTPRPTEDADNRADASIHLHAGVYIFAHVYGVEELQELALVKLKESLTKLIKGEASTKPETIVPVLSRLFSQLHETDSLLKDLTQNMMKSWLSSSEDDPWASRESTSGADELSWDM